VSAGDKRKRQMLRDATFLGIALITAATLLLVFPEKRQVVTATSRDLFVQMISILPAVMVLRGLFTVWVSREMVVRHLGKASGMKGAFLAVALGALPTGPLYVAFPLAATLLRKGARISNVIIFLSAWACIKVPQEVMELQFLGPRFMATRLVLTVIFVVAMGASIERLIEWGDRGGASR